MGSGPSLILARIFSPKTRRAVVEVSFVSGTSTRLYYVVIVMQSAIN